jgi:hypothetical protein
VLARGTPDGTAAGWAWPHQGWAAAGPRGWARRAGWLPWKPRDPVPDLLQWRTPPKVGQGPGGLGLPRPSGHKDALIRVEPGWMRMRGLSYADPQRHRVPGTAVRHRHPARRPADDPAAVPAPHLAAAGTRRRPAAARRRYRAVAARGQRLPRGRRQLDQRPVLGPRLRPGADPDGAGQLTVPRAGAHPWRPSRGSAVPPGPVPPAGGRDQLLPLLGRRHLDTTAGSCPVGPPTSSRILRPDGDLLSQR